jgi:predicted  nucleic acid-binding Zn-ribbon protein
MRTYKIHWLSLFLIPLLTAAATANDAALKAGIVRMLDVGWSVTPTARAAADAQYSELQMLAPGDERLLTASILVLLQQRRYEEAGKRMDELLAIDDDNILGLRAKCWLAATLKNHGSAMISAEELRAALPAETTQNVASEANARDQLAFLGRLCGFLAGPLGESVDQGDRKLLEKTILTGLSKERQTVFEEARDGVTQKFFELTDAKVDTEQKNVADRKTEADQTLQDVESARKEIDARAKELEESYAKLQKELNDELAEIARLDRPLVAELARLRARADLVRRDLASYQIQIDRLSIQFANEMDPVIRNALRRDIDQLNFLASRVSGDLAAINRQGQAVEAQRATLAQRLAQAQGNFGGQLDRINKELVSLGKKEKRAEIEEKKAKRPVSASSTKTIALSTQVTALSTYDKFPLEQAKQRLLSELK